MESQSKLFNILLIIFLIFSACEPIQIINTLSSGYTAQSEFSTAIPFSLRSGAIIVHPVIKGKRYDFVLDSGAPTLLDSSLARKLEVDSVTELGLNDSQGRSSTATLGEMDSLQLGDVQFREFGVAVANMRDRFPFHCVGMDGIIGSNLMRLGVWQIDFEDEMIYIASSSDSLPYSIGPNRYDFSEGIIYGIPSIDDFLLKGDEYTIDLGSTGSLTINNADFEKVLDNFPVKDKSKVIGYNSYGLNGSIHDTIQYAIIDSVIIGNRNYQTEIESTDEEDNLMGTEFLKNFLLTLDWKENYMALNSRKKAQEKIAFAEDGFRLLLEGEDLTIGRIFTTSEAYHAGIRFGDTLVSIRSKNGQSHYPSDPCTSFFWQKSKYKQDSLILIRKDREDLDTLYLN
jgi:hypothetical protein